MAKAAAGKAATVEGVNAFSVPADGFFNGVPYWNDRLPWLMDVPLCTGLHDAYRDAMTGYGYCRACGFSFGLI